MEIVLVQPEIAPNTGNIIRLCANTLARLHLVRPLGFTIRDKHLKRAGLDYHALAQVEIHDDWATCREGLRNQRLLAITATGAIRYTDFRYTAGDVLVFGSESAGLPAAVLTDIPHGMRLRIPMANDTRSLNLANAVAIVAYEAWRQQNFSGGR